MFSRISSPRGPEDSFIRLTFLQKLVTASGPSVCEPVAAPARDKPAPTDMAEFFRSESKVLTVDDEASASTSTHSH